MMEVVVWYWLSYGVGRVVLGGVVWCVLRAGRGRTGGCVLTFKKNCGDNT